MSKLALLIDFPLHSLHIDCFQLKSCLSGELQRMPSIRQNTAVVSNAGTKGIKKTKTQSYFRKT
jgi:hypothetical protein